MNYRDVREHVMLCYNFLNWTTSYRATIIGEGETYDYALYFLSARLFPDLSKSFCAYFSTEVGSAHGDVAPSFIFQIEVVMKLLSAPPALLGRR